MNCNLLPAARAICRDIGRPDMLGTMERVLRDIQRDLQAELANMRAEKEDRLRAQFDRDNEADRFDCVL